MALLFRANSFSTPRLMDKLVITKRLIVLSVKAMLQPSSSSLHLVTVTHRPEINFLPLNTK